MLLNKSFGTLKRDGSLFWGQSTYWQKYYVPQFHVMNINVKYVFIFIIFSYITSNFSRIYLFLFYVNILIVKLEYLFGPKIFCLNETNFVSFKQNISLHQRKCYKQIIFLIQSKKINILIQSNIFSECN